MMTALFLGGIDALKDYIATHILTCLVPAFFLAGSMVAFINRQAILYYLGEKASKLKSFSLASAASFFVAACSCTVIPVSSGLYYSGASVGVAFIVLWVAPSTNILSLVYTGNILGGGIVAARIVAALVMALIVGSVMTYFFQRERQEATAFQAQPSEAREQILAKRHLILIILIVLSLLMPNYIGQTGPYLTKVIIWAAMTAITAIYAWRALSKEEIKSWVGETWWFVKIILPLLLIGVFIVGIIGKLLPEEWIRTWLGGSSIRASFFATMIGAISYFATMTEAPFVDTLMKLGMGKGPALTLLLTGPGLSLPNWVAIARIFGIKKSFVYVITIVVAGTIMGWFFGNFIF